MTLYKKVYNNILKKQNLQSYSKNSNVHAITVASIKHMLEGFFKFVATTFSRKNKSIQKETRIHEIKVRATT